jgi:nucleoside 2-deoxyribosyltransferase
MKIYFAGAIRGGRENAGIYAKLIEFMGQFGEVLTYHVGKSNVMDSEKELTDQEIHDRDLKWLSEADLVIAEVSAPSLGVGYEIGKAVDAGKPVLCLYNYQSEFELSALIGGCREINLVRYEHLSDTYPVIREFVKEIKE